MNLKALLLLALLLGSGSLAWADVLADARKMAAAGQTEPALAVVDRALLTQPTDPELRFLRGVLLADLGRSEAAMAAFVALNQDFPELPDPLNNLAVLYAARGDLERARELLEAALRNQPRHLAARENLGDVYLRLAIREWQAVSEQTRPEPALTRKLALARQLVVQLADRP